MIIRYDRPRTRSDLVRDAVIYGLLSAWGVWILHGGLSDGAFRLRVTTVEAGSPLYPVIAVLTALLALVPVLLCAVAIVSLSTGQWKTPSNRDTEGL